MTKSQIRAQIFELINSEEWNITINQLLELESKDRITYGAFIVYDLDRSYYYLELQSILNRASKSTDYLKSLKRTNLFLWSYILEGLKKDLAKAQEFIGENLNCPFYLTQKQRILHELKPL